MTAHQVPSYEDLFAFARLHHGKHLRTSWDMKPFQVLANGDKLCFVPFATGKERHARADKVLAVLGMFRGSHSMRPGQYQNESHNASYLLPLIRAWQNGKVDDEPPVFERTPPNALDQAQRDELWRRVHRAVLPRGRAKEPNGRIGHGFEIVSNASSKLQIGAVYWSDNNIGNDVEIAFDLDRLAHPGEGAWRLRAWFEEAAMTLCEVPAHNHSRNHADWFRAGFTLPLAHEFFALLQQQLSQILEDKDRWLVSSSELEGRADGQGAALDVESEVLNEQVASSHETPIEATRASSIAQMLEHAKDACSQSGEEISSTRKTKRFLFGSEAAFEDYVMKLLDAQGNRCKVSELPLQFLGCERDIDLLASLDRIDANGDYVPGNLQVVCRFINRWKSDDSNENFQRLIGLLRAAKPVGDKS